MKNRYVAGAALLLVYFAYASAMQVSKSDNPEKLKRSSEQEMHLLDGDYSLVTRTAALPQNIKSALAKEFQQNKLDLANPDEKFNAGDVGLPGRRLIFAGVSKDRCFIHYEKGGIALTRNLLVFQITSEQARLLWSGSGFRAHDLQELRSALGSGKFVGTAH